MKVGSEGIMKYEHSQGVAFDPLPRTGYLSIEVLPFLKGRPVDDIALAYIHALRPSRVRVSFGLVTCDAMPWRVTVIVDEHDQIHSVQQEVNVGLPEPFGCGYELEHYLRTGVHSPIPEGGLAIVNARAVQKLVDKGCK
jgi:hypothetical protein